jgi:hypothetical protein
MFVVVAVLVLQIIEHTRGLIEGNKRRRYLFTLRTPSSTSRVARRRRRRCQYVVLVVIGRHDGLRSGGLGFGGTTTTLLASMY